MGDLFKIESLIGVGATSHVYMASTWAFVDPLQSRSSAESTFKQMKCKRGFIEKLELQRALLIPAVVSVLMTGQLPIRV